MLQSSLALIQKSLPLICGVEAWCRKFVHASVNENNFTQSIDPHIENKFLVPVLPHPPLLRPRLFSLLNEGISRKLTLVIAPAGFGKTALLSTWMKTLRLDEVSAAWLSLDEEDNRPTQFWEYVLATIERVHTGTGADSLRLLHSPQSVPFEHILAPLINALNHLETELILILDDYHVIVEPSIHKALEFLVDHLPTKAHVILVSRSQPPLPLARWRGLDELVEIPTKRLRCTSEETELFLGNVMHFNLPGEFIREVNRRTEGWLVGLQLLGLSLKHQTFSKDLWKCLSSNDSHILDYLTDKVLRQQPDEVQSFLIQTSILNRFSAPLCEAVTGRNDCQAILDYLQRESLFLFPLDERHYWYHYHILFAEALRIQLERVGSTEAMVLHQRAADWFFGNKNSLEAAYHALQAHRWELAVKAIEAIANDLPFRIDEMPYLLKMLEEIPTSYYRKRPSLSLQRARYYLFNGQFTRYGQWLEIVKNALADTPLYSNSEMNNRDKEKASQLGGVLARQGIVAAFEGDAQKTREFIQQATPLLSEQDAFNLAPRALALSRAALIDGNLSQASVYAQEASDLYLAAGNIAFAIIQKSNAGYFLSLQGKLHQASQALKEAIQLGTETDQPTYSAVGLAYVYQADLQREWNHLEKALEQCLEGLHLAEQGGYGLYLEDAYLVLSRIQMTLRNWEEAETAIRHADQLPITAENPILWTWITSGDRIRLLIANGQMDQACTWADTLEKEPAPKSVYARECAAVACIQAWLAVGKLDNAEDKLIALVESTSPAARPRLLIETLLLQAQLYFIQHRQVEMLNAARRVVSLANQEGFVRTIVDEGIDMRQVLSVLAHKEPCPKPFLDTLTSAFKGSGESTEHYPVTHSHSGPDFSLIEPLTLREKDVLRYLAQGDSNQEIARQLIISIDTVKRHTTNIFEKLGVSNRTQAVIQARKQGLVTDDL